MCGRWNHLLRRNGPERSQHVCQVNDPCYTHAFPHPPGTYDLHAVPYRKAIRPSTCLLIESADSPPRLLGEERTRRKIQQDLPSALSFDIIHNYRYIMQPTPTNSTNSTQPTQPAHLNRLFIASVWRQGRVRSGPHLVWYNRCRKPTPHATFLETGVNERARSINGRQNPHLPRHNSSVCKEGGFRRTCAADS